MHCICTSSLLCAIDHFAVDNTTTTTRDDNIQRESDIIHIQASVGCLRSLILHTRVRLFYATHETECAESHKQYIRTHARTFEIILYNPRRRPWLIISCSGNGYLDVDFHRQCCCRVYTDRHICDFVHELVCVVVVNGSANRFVLARLTTDSTRCS